MFESRASGICRVRRIAGRQDVPVASGKLGGRELRPGIGGEAEELHYVLDHLGEDELLPARYHWHRARARAPSGAPMPSSSRTFTESNSIPRTER